MEADQKLLADPILDFEIALTPQLLQFGNISILLEQYSHNQVDTHAEDLGLKQKLLSTQSKKATTRPVTSRLT